MRFVWGVVWIAVGFILIRYTFGFVQTFGRIGWAENYLGGGFGGTYTLYKIVGVLIIGMAFIYMFGRFGMFTSPLTGVFGGLK